MNKEDTMTTSSTDIYTTIQAIDGHFSSALMRGDTASIADFYSDTGMLLPAGSGVIQGKPDIKAFWQAAIDMGIRKLKLDILEVEVHGDTAIEMSKYTLTNEDEEVIDRGKGIVIWKYNNSSWMMHRDIWNSDI
mgnify:FL=1